jgi:hypothetical protein
MLLFTAKPFFLVFAKMSYVHFVPVSNHLAIAYFIPRLKKGTEKGEAHFFTFLESKKVSLTFSPFLTFLQSITILWIPLVCGGVVHANLGQNVIPHNPS